MDQTIPWIGPRHLGSDILDFVGLVGLGGSETDDVARAKSFLEQDKAIVGKLDHLLKRDPAKPCSLKGVVLAQEHLRWQDQTGSPGFLEEVRRPLHKFLRDLFAAASGPRWVANH